MASKNIQVLVPEAFASLSARLKKHLLKEYINPAIKETVEELQLTIPGLIIRKIKSSDVWGAIAGEEAGSEERDLQAVLGIIDPNSRLAYLERALLRIITVKVIKGSRPGIEIGVIKDSDVINLVSANFGQYVSGPSGEVIPWLEWLLLGDGHVSGYHIEFGRFKSRSGRARMEEEGNWSIKPSLRAFGIGSGENFLTEAFRDGELIRQIRDIVFPRLVQNLRGRR
jgi:hypothetical protein